MTIVILALEEITRDSLDFPWLFVMLFTVIAALIFLFIAFQKPRSFPQKLRKAIIYYYNGEYQQSADLFEILLKEMQLKTKSQLKQAEIMSRRAFALFGTGNQHDAQQLLVRAKAIDKTTVDAVYDEVRKIGRETAVQYFKK
jgi:tetratricopeptide (TPR) repeat protein